MKFNELLANIVVFHNTVELTDILNALKAEGKKVRAADVAALSPYTTRHIRRFGDYTLDTSPPDRSVQPHLDLDENDGAEDAAGGVDRLLAAVAGWTDKGACAGCR